MFENESRELKALKTFRLRSKDNFFAKSWTVTGMVLAQDIEVGIYYSLWYPARGGSFSGRDIINMDVTDTTFGNQVLQSDIPVLVDFWAPWCGPCKMVGPIVEELAKEYKEKLKVVKLNVDDNQQSASMYSVMSIPTLMFFKGGKPVKTMVGAQGKDALKKVIDEVLAS